MGVDPVSLAIVGAVVGGIGDVVSTRGEMSQAAYKGAVAERNAAIAEENRVATIEASQREQMDWSESARQQMGSLLAGFSASGLAAGGSNAQIRAGQEALILRDAERIRAEGVGEADRFAQQRADFLSEANVAKAERRNALTSGILRVVSSLVGGATAVNRAKGIVS